MAPRQSTRLAKRQVLDLPSSSSDLPQVVSKKKKTNAERCKEYREKLKDTGRYEQYLEKQKMKGKQYRENASDELKKKMAEQTKLRMREMRKRKKEAQGLTTRHTQEHMRAKWRAEYEQRKARMTPQKKAAINAKRRRQYAARKAEMAQQSAQKLQPAPSEPSVQQEPKQTSLSEGLALQMTNTPAARRKHLQRARSVLPRSPRKYVQTVLDLQNKASPRKKALFKAIVEQRLDGHSTNEDVANCMGDEACGRRIKNFLSSIKRKKSKSAIAARKVILAACRGQKSARATSAALGVHRRTVKKNNALFEKGGGISSSAVKTETNKERKLETEIADFLEISATILPQKKLVSSKTGKATMLLSKPIDELHKDFTDATGLKISKSHFAKCRPDYIRPARTNTLRQCLCEYCENVKLKLKSTNGIAAKVNNNCRIRHERHAVDLITCGRTSNRWHMNCAYGKCGACGPPGLDHHLRPLQHHRGSVSWFRWENTAMVIGNKTVTRKALVKKQGTMEELTSKLREEVTFLGGHLFRADWQFDQFDAIKRMAPFPSTTVCMVLDFAENFNCTYQNEVQAAHWCYEQCTIHPIVCYYRCPHCPETVTESLVFLSNDRLHDFNAVHAFVSKAIDHLRCVRHIPVDHVVQWTDGCAAQYKSKGPFADVSYAAQDYGCTFDRHFFGSRHGKGPSDGESAVVKSGAARAIRSGTAVVQNAEDLYTFCARSHLCKEPDTTALCKSHSFRAFFYVPNVVRNRGRTVKTLKGTRSLHAVRCVEANVLLTRSLSCACSPCVTGVGECANRDVVGPWVKKTLTPVPDGDLVAPEVAVQDGSDLVTLDLEVPVEASTDELATQEGELDASPESLPGPADVHQLVVSEGDFVKVSFAGRQRQVFFYGKVMSREGTDALIHFFKETEGKFSWADKSWVCVDQVLCKVSAPKLASGRGLSFVFE